MWTKIKKLIKPIVISYILYLASFIILATRQFYPYHRVIALVIFLISKIPLFYSIYKNRLYLKKPAKKVYIKFLRFLPYIAVAFLTVIFIYVAIVLVPVEDTTLVKISDDELKISLQEDLDELFLLYSNINVFLDMQRENDSFKKEFANLNSKEKENIRQSWVVFINLVSRSELLINRYKGFFQLDYNTKPGLHSEAFLIGYFSFLQYMKLALEVHDIVNNNYFMKKFLNDRVKKYGIKKGSYSKIVQKINNMDNLLRLNAGSAYWQLVRSNIDEKNPFKPIIDKEISFIFNELGNSSWIFINNPLDVIEEEAFKTWLPIQKNIALQMSYIRTTDRDYFIKDELIKAIKGKIRPGDILLERRRWHMTNAGIPGFWPHAALYIGTPEEIDTYFSELSDYLKKKPSLFIKEKYPDVFADFNNKDEFGNKYSVIEAKRPGVIFTSLEHSANADYVAALSPKLSKKARFDAIVSSLEYYKRPYDYDFDFTTDSALVCSELVYKAYNNREGFNLQVNTVSGRLLLSPTMIAEKFINEYKSNNSQLDFVIFIDSKEKDNQAFVSDQDSFVKTLNRPNWDVFLE